MTSTERARRARPRRRGRVVAVAAVAVAGLLITGCTAPGEAPRDASRVLQAVHVRLAPDAAITAIDGTAVYLDQQSKESTTTETSYIPRDVVDDLPVRVVTEYRTEKGAGSDLSELKGYTGRIRLSVTVENLTVAPASVKYDVAGSSRVAPALVGVPISVAASTQLRGVGTGGVVLDSGNGGETTNGVVSSATGGDAVVQWASLLVPPQTGASATFQLVADVEDFEVPEIDLAVQPGIHTDLSFDGVIGSAFDDSPTSALALQQRTISLISDVNSVLSRAGAAITEVRDNLDNTSKTLGVRTAQQLRDSSESLTATMRSLGGQLTDLQSDLSATTSDAESAVSAQLRATIASMNAMLGDTTGTPPSLRQGEGCSATVAAAESGSTLYSAFLLLSGQLKAYAEANAGCRDEIAAGLQRTVGPDDPGAATCSSPSLTCALYESSSSVTGELIRLVASGQQIADALDSQLILDALRHYGVLSADIDAVLTGLGTASAATSSTRVDDAIEAVSAAVDSALAQTDGFDAIHSTAATALEELDSGQAGSILEQNAALAAELCALDPTYTAVDQTRIEELLSYLTDVACDGSTPLMPLAEYPVPLDARLRAQAEAWTTVSAATDMNDPASALARVRASLAEIGEALSAVRAAAGSDRADVAAAIAAVTSHASQARADADLLDTDLGAVRSQQEGLAASVRGAFQSAASAASAKIAGTVNDQIQRVSQQSELGRAALVDAYNRTIAGLSSTSEGVLGDGGTTIDGQKSRLTRAEAEATKALGDESVAALERIAQRTIASSRDVDASTTLLQQRLTDVLLDLGDRAVQGSGLLGAMAASAAKSDTADYQLALASQNASGYANIRAEDVAAILLGQAQFAAALDAAAARPPFHLELPEGATWQTVYSFQIGGAARGR